MSMVELKFWKVPKGKFRNEDSTQWSGRLGFWRIKLGYHIYRHEYPDYPWKTKTTGDRWVFHPSFIYDRKTPQNRLSQRFLRAFKQYRHHKNANNPPKQESNLVN